MVNAVGGGPLLKRWWTRREVSIGKHSLCVLSEQGQLNDELLVELRDMFRAHFVAPDLMAQWVHQHGAPSTAKLLQHILPKQKKARSGDFGEVLATEYAEQYLGYQVPVRRLRYKDGRDMALRGDDIVGVRNTAQGALELLKGESKSRVALRTAHVEEAELALDRDSGRPTRHSVIFVAQRLHEQGEDSLAIQLENAVIHSFRANPLEHLLFTVTGNNPERFLEDHLKGCRRNTYRRYAVGVHLPKHAKFVEDLFSGI